MYVQVSVRFEDFFFLYYPVATVRVFGALSLHCCSLSLLLVLPLMSEECSSLNFLLLGCD